MKAMIFAAGLGTRLFPITKDKPKALAPFLNETLLSYNLKYLSNFGIKDFVINIHHFAEKIENYLSQNNNFGFNINISNEIELLNTAGGLFFAKEKFLPNEDIILYNVDVICNLDINKMYQFHKENKAKATLAVKNRDTQRYLLFDEKTELCGWKNKLSDEEIWCKEKITNYKELAFSGVQIINTSLFQNEEIKPKSITSFYLEKGAENKIIGYENAESYWFDCGKTESLNNATDFLLKQKITTK